MEEIEKQLRERLKRNAFMQHNHIELERVTMDGAVFSLEIRPESKNPMGIVHGGVFYSMADNAAGFAAHTDGRCYVTQSGSMNFLHNRAEGIVRAEARVRHRGKSTCLAVVDITDEEGTLLATGDFSFFCVDRALLDKKAGK